MVPCEDLRRSTRGRPRTSEALLKNLVFFAALQGGLCWYGTTVTGEVKDGRQTSEADKRGLLKSDDKIKDMGIKVQHLTYDSQKVPGLQEFGTARNVVLTATHVAPPQSTKALNATTRDHTSSRSELEALHAAERRWKGVSQDFAESACAVYSELGHTHATSHHSQLNDVLSYT